MKKASLVLLLFGLAWGMSSVTPAIAQTVEAEYLSPQLNDGTPYRFLRFGTPSTYWAGFMWNNNHATYGDGDDFSIFTYGNRDITMRTGSGNIVLHPSGRGKVGIGTTNNPQATLHVYETASVGGTTLNLDAQTNENPNIRFSTEGQVLANIRVDDRGEDQLQFQVGNRMLRALNINPTGEVGIGTENPSELLTVNGTAKAEEVIVSEDVGADFVFEDEYRLPRLSEVESFIQSHKHLPEIPSAEQMIANGVKVGDLQMKLLQKIEELTLYAIQQQKNIMDARTAIQKLQTQLHKQKKYNANQQQLLKASEMRLKFIEKKLK